MAVQPMPNQQTTSLLTLNLGLGVENEGQLVLLSGQPWPYRCGITVGQGGGVRFCPRLLKQKIAGPNHVVTNPERGR